MMHSDWESGEMHKGMFVEASGTGEDVNKIEKRKKEYHFVSWILYLN